MGYRRGARRLKEAGVAAVSSKDLVRSFSGAYYRHRCIANEVAVSGIVQGFRAATEREIAQGTCRAKLALRANDPMCCYVTETDLVG